MTVEGMMKFWQYYAFHWLLRVVKGWPLVFGQRYPGLLALGLDNCIITETTSK